MTEGKIVVLAVRQLDERQAVSQLLEDLQMEVHHAESGWDAIHLLEDQPCDFLVMDIQLSDMHAWKMLGTLKESVNLDTLPTIVIMDIDEQAKVPMSNVTTVIRPVAIARLRHIILDMFST
ncbi:MAG: response regulator [Anaerolineae bacterium]|nr:response regulator [Anaerolineae bacterium]MDQ7036727.1 response regulator [Anaerolineae bacterium]